MNNGHRRDGDLSREEIEAAKKRLTSRDYLAFQARCVKAFHSADAGIFLRQLVYWTGKGKANGWFWKTVAQLEEETGLGERQQRRARKILKAKGVIEEARRGVPCRMHYRVNLERVGEILGIATPLDENQEVRLNDSFDDFDDIPYENNYGPSSSGGNSAGTSSAGNSAGASAEGIREEGSSEGTSPATIQEITPETNAGDYEQEIPPLQGGSSSSFWGPDETSPPTAGSLRKPQILEQETPSGDHFAQPEEHVAAAADPVRVALAGDALRELLARWPGYVDDLAAEKWTEIPRTLKHLQYTDELFTPLEVMVAARELEGTEREEAAI